MRLNLKEVEADVLVNSRGAVEPDGRYPCDRGDGKIHIDWNAHYTSLDEEINLFGHGLTGLTVGAKVDAAIREGFPAGATRERPLSHPRRAD